MLHHLSFVVSDLDAASAFYDAALGAWGYVRVWTDPDAVGYGLSGDGDRFAIVANGKKAVAPWPGFHLAFAAKSREAVDAFYAAAIANGERDNGPPELCVEYGPHYYAAFVFDPDGYAIEAIINESV